MIENVIRKSEKKPMAQKTKAQAKGRSAKATASAKNTGRAPAAKAAAVPRAVAKMGYDVKRTPAQFPARDAELVELAGHSIGSIAETMGVSKSTVGRRTAELRTARPLKPPKSPADPGSLHKKMMQLLSSLWVTHAIGTFARLGLADAMDAGADSAEAIAIMASAENAHAVVSPLTGSPGNISGIFTSFNSDDKPNATAQPAKPLANAMIRPVNTKMAFLKNDVAFMGIAGLG
ncbi:hypothetical protein B4Q13_15835 [Lacticaseibacillus rhamnosus]